MAQNEKKRYFYGLADDLINTYVEGLGFKSCVDDYASFLEVEINSKMKRFLYIQSGGFGIKRGRTKFGQIFYPTENWEALQTQADLADVIFILVNYENCHAWSVNGKKRKGEQVQNNLPNWWEHSGLLVIEGKNEKWKYFDCQLYVGEKLSGHFAYELITTSIQRKVEQVLKRKFMGISVKKFADHVG